MKIFKRIKYFSLGLFVVGLIGCTSASPVVRTQENNLNVIGYGGDESSSRNTAINAACKYCKKAKQEMILVRENTSYKGLMNENVGKATKIASDVLWTIGNSKGSRAVGTANGNEDYETKVEFYCR